MLTLGRHGQEGVSERGKSKTKTKTETELEALLKKFLSDHHYSGIFEIRHVDRLVPLQVKFFDASASKSAYGEQLWQLRHPAAEEEEEVSQGSTEEDTGGYINGNKWVDRLGFWEGWGSFDSSRKRPTELPVYFSQLNVEGRIQANSFYLPRIKTSVSWSGGALPYCVWELENLTTNCNRVLLVFDSDTRDAIMPFLAEHASNYLVVVVGWDRTSYLFLRKLAHSVAGLTFIAITDLDPHHLDCLTFLAAPPSEVLTHYGWDLSEGCKLTGVNEDASLDIKWLGLRPSDIDAHLACFKLYAFRQGETDFKLVSYRLLTIPTFANNQAWKDELQRLQDCSLFMAFAFLRPTRSSDMRSYIKDVYLPQKLNKQDWV